MFVLRQAQHERVGAESGADRAQRQAGQFPARLVEMHGLDPDPQRDEFVGKAHLLVKLQRARMHGHGARGLAGAAVAVDDAKRHAMAGQPQGEHEAGRAGADDQDLGGVHLNSIGQLFSIAQKMDPKMTMSRTWRDISVFLTHVTTPQIPRSNSLMPVLARVLASTRLTITAQYREYLPSSEGRLPDTTTEPAGTRP